jgi:hypothetical protein
MHDCDLRCETGTHDSSAPRSQKATQAGFLATVLLEGFIRRRAVRAFAPTRASNAGRQEGAENLLAGAELSCPAGG